MSTRLARLPAKKISSWVRPGVCEVRASALRPASALIRLDFPTLERPANAISIGPMGGSAANDPAAATKRHSPANNFRPASISSALRSVMGVLYAGAAASSFRPSRRSAAKAARAGIHNAGASENGFRAPASAGTRNDKEGEYYIGLSKNTPVEESAKFALATRTRPIILDCKSVPLGVDAIEQFEEAFLRYKIPWRSQIIVGLPKQFHQSSETVSAIQHDASPAKGPRLRP